MHIGEFALEAGTTTRTVRYYEEMGLILPECRSQGGFRCYSDEQLVRLRMILSLKSFEFDLDQIKNILDKRGEHDTGGKLAGAILKDLNGRLTEIDSQIEHYAQVRSELSQAIESLCCCLPCELRSDERRCSSCPVFGEESGSTQPYFHAPYMKDFP